MNENMYLGKRLSRRATAYFAERLGKLVGLPYYFADSWSTPWAYIGAVIDKIEGYKRDAQKYYELRKLIKKLVDYK